ncbi:MAG: restriction endonuclease subunit S [Candidatus Micrarchaeaceae archaeon]
MAVTSVVRLSELDGAKRMDAEYYQPEYLRIAEKLRLCKPLKNFVGAIIRPSSVKREYAESGYLFMLTQNIKENYLDFSEKFYISSQVAGQIAKNLLRAGDIVTVGTGNIGLSTTIPMLEENIYASPDIIILRDPQISPFYISTYLNSKIGKLFLNRIIYGISQPHITTELLGRIPVPILDRENINKISSMVENALDMLKQSEYFYLQAESLLLSELGLQNFKADDKLFYTINLSEVNIPHRIDAEYFNPKYERIFDFIKCPVKKLGEITRFLNHAKQPPYIENGEIPIITQKHLGESFLNLDVMKDPETKFTSDEWLKRNPSYKLRIGDVLYYSVGAYIGKTNIVLEEIKATAASFITIIRTTEEVNPVYLIVVLNSIVGQLQSGKWQSATAQQYIYPKDIKNFKIPILPKPTQQEIAKLIQQSYDAKSKAKELLEKSKKIIEDAIAFGGDRLCP